MKSIDEVSNPTPPSERPGVMSAKAANVGETLQICNLHTGVQSWNPADCEICQLRAKLAEKIAEVATINVERDKIARVAMVEVADFLERSAHAYSRPFYAVVSRLAAKVRELAEKGAT